MIPINFNLKQLPNQPPEIYYGNKVSEFNIDEFKKKCLINGLDDIDLSMEKITHINNYEKKINVNKPWILNNE